MRSKKISRSAASASTGTELRERVIRRDDEHQLVRVHRPALDPLVTQLADQAQLHLAAQHHVDDLLGMPGPDQQADAGMLADEPVEERRQDVRADGGCGADRQIGRWCRG